MKTATVKTRVWAGAARLEVRDLDELRDAKATGAKPKPAKKAKEHTA